MAKIQPIPTELAIPVCKGHRLSPEELGLLAKQLAATSNPVEAARIQERLTRGFYGSSAAPR